MTDVVVDRLRIRGGHARRLATVAARALPGALERALSDLADVELGRLTVRLGDPADHDDATLAALWADGIRQAALDAGARVRAAGAGGASRDDPLGVSGAPAVAGGPGIGDARADGVAGVEEVTAALAGWLAAGATAVPSEVAALSDPQLAAVVLRRLGAERATALAVALADRAGRLEAAQHGPPTCAGAPEPAGRPDHPDHGRPHRGRPGDVATRTGAASPSSKTDAGALADQVVAAARALRPLLELHGGAAVDPAGVTRAAGVVLAYPWLADVCREAVDQHPRAEPSHPRRVALAALADPDDLDLVDDPLVCFLAGAPAGSTPAGRLAPLDARGEVRAAADDVLRRFVALLPGFERSSTGFIRAAWVLRAGALDLGHDPARLVARTAPLDVVLPRLPYPVGLLRLPWTPVLTVRFRP
jgi:hypothetical protein